MAAARFPVAKLGNATATARFPVAKSGTATAAVRFKRRKNCVLKKTMELSVLCGSKTGILISGTDGKVETWPENHADVRSVIDKCWESDMIKNRKNNVADKGEEKRTNDALPEWGTETERKRKIWLEGSEQETLRRLFTGIEEKMMFVNDRMVECLNGTSAFSGNSMASSGLDHNCLNSDSGALDFSNYWLEPEPVDVSNHELLEPIDLSNYGLFETSDLSSYGLLDFEGLEENSFW